MQLRPSLPISLLTAIALFPPACFDPRVTDITGDSSSDTGPGLETGTGSSSGSSSTGVDPDDSSGPPPAICGNGVVEGDEVCDDGVNDGSYGGCTPDCSALADFCGDGIQNGTEACDDGDDIDGNGCNVNCVVSGTVLWTVTYDGPDHGPDAARGVAVDVDDAIIVTGAVSTAGNSSAWVRKYTPSGAAIWTEVFPSANDDSFAGPVVTLSNGDIVFGGGFDTANAPTSPDAWLRRISSLGAPVWTRTHASPQGHWDAVADVDIDDNGYLYALFTEGNRGFVRKYDPEGAELWSRFLDDSIRPWALATDANGGSVVVGNDGSGVGFTPHITRLDSDGQVEWSQDLEEYSNSYFTTVDVDAVGNIVAGLLSVASDNRLVFFDPAGTSIGAVFPHVTDPGVRTESVVLLADGQIIAGGVKGADAHLWVTRYSADGDELWTYTYNGDDWGYGIDTVTSLTVDSSGNVIAVGFIQDVAATIQDVWVTKFAP